MKKYVFPIYIAIVLVLGIVTVPLFHSGYFGMLVGGFFTVPFYYHILFFLLSYFLSVLLHELTHLIAFKLKGIKIKALLVLFFVIHEYEGKWHMSLNFKLLKLGGGMVIPSFDEIKEEYGYYKSATAISTSLIAAPIFTLVFGGILLLLNIFFLYDLPYFTVFSFYTLIFTILFTLVSNISNDMMYGDFKAYEKFNKDPLFKLAILTQYVSALSVYHLYLLEAQLNKYPISEFSDELLPILSTLFEHFVFDSNVKNETLLERANYIKLNAHLLRRFMRKEVYIPLAQYVIYYLDKCNQKEDAHVLFELFKRNLDQQKLPELMKTYLTKQTAHALKLSDESAYLSNKSLIAPSRYAFIFESLPDFYEDEHNHNLGYERLPEKFEDA